MNAQVAESRIVTSEQLDLIDEVVYDAASELGAKANNQGLGGQMSFLTKVCGWSRDVVTSLQPHMFDAVVRGAASKLASDANNEGLGGQLDFLMQRCGWSEQEIAEALNAQK